MHLISCNNCTIKHIRLKVDKIDGSINHYMAFIFGRLWFKDVWMTSTWQYAALKVGERAPPIQLWPPEVMSRFLRIQVRLFTPTCEVPLLHCVLSPNRTHTLVVVPVCSRASANQTSTLPFSPCMSAYEYVLTSADALPAKFLTRCPGALIGASLQRVTTFGGLPHMRYLHHQDTEASRNSPATDQDLQFKT